MAPNQLEQARIEQQRNERIARHRKGKILLVLFVIFLLLAGPISRYCPWLFVILTPVLVILILLTKKNLLINLGIYPWRSGPTDQKKNVQNALDEQNERAEQQSRNQSFETEAARSAQERIQHSLESLPSSFTPSAKQYRSMQTKDAAFLILILSLIINFCSLAIIRFDVIWTPTFIPGAGDIIELVAICSAGTILFSFGSIVLLIAGFNLPVVTNNEQVFSWASIFSAAMNVLAVVTFFPYTMKLLAPVFDWFGPILSVFPTLAAFLIPFAVQFAAFWGFILAAKLSSLVTPNH